MATKENERLNCPHRNKVDSLEAFRSDTHGHAITTNQGVKLSDNQNTLKAGARGPSLLEDFIMREKITHFDHERIPERIVHARGEAAHGYFQVYKSLSAYTKAGFLTDTARKTPVFVRFSTVAGSRGSADTVRDVRGFAVKFYTDEGIFDLVGNNIPVFFIQDAMKFPDLIHAVKPEPHNEIPQAQSAHDTFWDFVSVMPESMHMIMWAMSDRAIPRSLRMMEGFGVHTFRLINDKGEAHFVKFHWKPVLGTHALVWEECLQLAGKDPDFHRRDLWEAIENGVYPEWELGLQIIPEADEHKFDFDLLDATKIIPEELVPVQRVGKLVLNRNPDNFFAETEQVAFHPGHIVPGIDFSNDPLLQGRLFSYTDTQLSRLGGPNFHEIPINRGICPFHNNQRDGMHRQTINVGKVAYEPNTLNDGYPRETPVKQGGFESYGERIEAHKIRARSESFADHYSQATLFWNSQSEPEKQHIVSAFQFELGKVNIPAIRERVVNMLVNIDPVLAQRVSKGLGIDKLKETMQKPHQKSSPALSMLNTVKDVTSRKIAILVADGINDTEVTVAKTKLTKEGTIVKILAADLRTVTGGTGKTIAIDHSIVTMPSVAFDAVIIPGGKAGVDHLMQTEDAVQFVREMYRHYKTILTSGEGSALLTEATRMGETDPMPGVIQTDAKNFNTQIEEFIEALKQHRHWNRA